LVSCGDWLLISRGGVGGLVGAGSVEWVSHCVALTK
jgi:hypothetical protein